MKAPRLFVVVTIMLALADATVLACPICFRVEENATTDGVLAAVGVLLGVTAVVLGAFGTFVIRFARREAGSQVTRSQITRSQIARSQIARSQITK